MPKPSALGFKALGTVQLSQWDKKDISEPAVYGCVLVTAEWKKNNIKRRYAFLLTLLGGFLFVPKVYAGMKCLRLGFDKFDQTGLS